MVKKNNMKLLNLIQENNESVIKEGNTLQTMFKTVADAKTLKSVNPSLFKTLEDVIKFGKAEGKPIEGYTAANKTNRTAINNVDELVYSIKAGGMTAEAMGQFYKGMLKSANTPRTLINEIVPEIIADKKFINTYGKMTPLQMEKELRNRKYSEAAIEEIMGKVKKDPNWKNTRKIGTAERKAKKTASGQNTTQTPTSNGSNVPPTQTKTLTERAKEILDNIKNKKMNWTKLVAWAAGIGVGVSALWWWLYNNSDTVPDGTPDTEPKDIGGEWAPCIQELIKSKEGELKTLENGLVVVRVVTPEYPEGLNFTSNGRVADVATKKMGSWKCKGTTPVIAESKKISLMGIIKEQSSEVSIDEMEKYVDTAVDDLDGFVDGGNLNSLLSILKSLKGKTFQGKDAVKEFLSLYKEDEGGDDFIADVNSVGVKTIGTKGILAKREILAIAGGNAGEATPPTPAGKLGLSHIDIVWDGEAKTGGEGSKPTPKKKSTNYHDCSNKDFPFEFGCIAPKIAEIQGCLGVTPQKGYFGPKTLAALKEKGFIDSSNTITKETYDKVSAICGGKGDETKKRDLSTEPIKTLKPKEIQTPKITGDLSKLPNIQPTDAMNGQKIYEALSSNYGDGSNPEYPYIFQEGGRIKYKGDGLNQETLNALNQFISSMGYTFMKQKAKEDYEMKYVWVKQ